MLRLVRASDATREYKRAATERLALAPGETVLDVGCGLGDDACALAALVGPGGLAVGVDLDRPEPLAPCAARFVTADALALPLADESVDAARVDRVLHLMDEPATAVRELARVLRPGGRIVVAEPDVASLRFPTLSDDVTRALVAHRARHARTDVGGRLATMCEDAGLRPGPVQRVVSALDRFVVCEVAFALPATLSALVSERRVELDAARAWVAGREREDAAGTFRAEFAGWIVRAERPGRP